MILPVVGIRIAASFKRMALLIHCIRSLPVFAVILLATMPRTYSFVVVKHSLSTELTLSNSQKQLDQSLDVCPTQEEIGVGFFSHEYVLNRRKWLHSFILTSAVGCTSSLIDPACAEESKESFESLAALAGRIQRDVDATNPVTPTQSGVKSDKTAYDFTLPILGVATSFSDMIRQEYISEKTLAGTPIKIPKVKAIIVVNIKQDDPVARKTIPELIALAAKYGRGDTSQLAIIVSPSDQGYYEPDTSQLIRLKLESEYGYGINPSTILTDKVNLLGTGAVPFWRWLQSTCRTPAGLGRVEGNFEKFLIDGRTGLPVRRYPRKYKPSNMADDIEALIAGRPIPPAKANYLEEWRTAAAEAERDTYRFEKGLNVFDQ
jgi:glutathione peroxidase-family protein